MGIAQDTSVARRVAQHPDKLLGVLCSAIEWQHVTFDRDAAASLAPSMSRVLLSLASSSPDATLLLSSKVGKQHWQHALSSMNYVM